jgi:hypothetical protein
MPQALPLALLPLNSAVDPDAPDLLAPLQYLILDMELFDTAMTEAGIDVGSVTHRAFRDGDGRREQCADGGTR